MRGKSGHILLFSCLACLLAGTPAPGLARVSGGSGNGGDRQAALLWEAMEHQLALALVDSLPDDLLSHFQRCRILTMAGEHQAAAAAAHGFLSAWPGSPLAADCRWMLAFNIGKMGLHRDAGDRFRGLAEEDTLLADIAWMRAAECHRNAGQAERARAIMDSLARRQPTFGDDVNLFPSGKPWSREEPARPPAAPPPSLSLRSANRAINRGRFQQALAQLAKFRQANPQSRETGLALYLTGKCYEKMGRLGPAAVSYRSVGDLQPGSPYADDGLFRAGWCRYKLNDFKGCLEAWASLERGHPASSLLVASRYWRLRIAEEAGEEEEAARLKDLLLAEHRYSYYWWRLRQSGAATGAADDGSPDQPGAGDEDFGWWLAGRRQYRQAFRLLDLGLLEDARYIADRLGQAAGNDALALYHLSLVYHRLGLDPQAINLARRAQALWMGPRPRQMYEVLYPRRYVHSIKNESRLNGLEPALVLAVMRQESHFVATARSRAGARGLMQIMPRTGRQLMGAGNFKPDTLYHPGTSIRYGTRFLARLVKQFDGSLVRALGAYNAGPHRMNTWLKSPRCRRDEDFLVEDIHLAETRDYIKKVLEGYYIYSWLLGEGL